MKLSKSDSLCVDNLVARTKDVATKTGDLATKSAALRCRRRCVLGMRWGRVTSQEIGVTSVGGGVDKSEEGG